MVADDNKFITKREKGISPEESVFLASLICNLRYIEQIYFTFLCAEIVPFIKPNL